jgi:hypothetical protein
VNDDDAWQPVAATPLPGENIELGARLASLEGRVDMIATNLAGHAKLEQGQYAQLFNEVRALRREVGEVRALRIEVSKLIQAARGIAGTDWDQTLGVEVPAAKKLTSRIVSLLAKVAKPIGIILGAAAAGAGLFHYGQSNGEEAPPPSEQHGSAERRDG